MKRITAKNLTELPDPCSHCLYWQTGHQNHDLTEQKMKRRKARWLGRVIEEFGNCGYIVYHDTAQVGFVQYAYPRFFPNIAEYPSGPPQDDVIFLACLYIIDKEARRKGFGMFIMKRLLVDLNNEGYEAVETFARRSSEENPSGPLTFYLKQGFNIVRERDDFPLVHYKLRPRRADI